MTLANLLIAAGVAGASLDILLHVLQLHDIKTLRFLQKHTAVITLMSVLLMGSSLLVQFNAGALLMNAFIAALAIISLVTGKAFDH